MIERHEIWRRLGRQASGRRLELLPERPLVSCHTGDQLATLRQLSARAKAHCLPCGAAMHRRKPNSVGRTWTLVPTAAILYVPANLLPVMTVVYFRRNEPDTILSGVKELIHAGMWPVALLVFFASIAVPMLKLIGLTFLLVTVQRGPGGCATAP